MFGHFMLLFGKGREKILKDLHAQPLFDSLNFLFSDVAVAGCRRGF